MIAELGVAPLALLDISAQSHRFNSRMLWASWIDTIRAHGALVFASDADFSLMKELLDGRDLSPDEKKRWAEMLVFLKLNQRLRIAKPGLAVHLDEVEDSEQIGTIRQELPLVAVLAQDAFARLYPDSDDGARRIDDRTSAAVAGSVTSAPVMRQLVDTALRERYLTDTDRDVIWNGLFHDVASRSKRVTVVDRYVFGELTRRQERRRRAAPPEHLAWLLERLDRTSPAGGRLQLITQLVRSGSSTQSVTGLLGLLRAAWSPSQTGNLKAVDIVGVPWDPGRHPHNRHIRFGDSWAYTLDEGLDRLGRPRVWDPDGFNFGFKWRAEHIDRLKERERLVQNDPAAERVTWTLRP